MEEVQVFNFESNEVRTLLINNEPWFVGKDVAEVLGYSKARNAIAEHVDKDDALKQGITDSLGRTQETTIINESGLYSLIMGSKLPSAKKFKRWVTSEVLPTIRKTGQYNIKDSYMIKDPIERAKRWIEEQEEKQALIAENAELKPKALFADAISASEGDINIGTLAKLLRQNGIDIGRNKLFEWLRDNGYLMKCGNEYNQPKQPYVDSEYFRVVEKPVNLKDGRTKPRFTTYVTPKGQKYFINKFIKLKNEGVM